MPALFPKSKRAERGRFRPGVEQLEARNLLTFFGGYRTVTELYADMANVAANYPDISEAVDYGQSYAATVGGVTTRGGDYLAGYDLMALHITNLAVPGPKPVFFLNAGIHAREISGPEVAMRWVDYLTQNYGSDPDVTWLVDSEDLWVVPTANPDGHWEVELGTQPPYSGSPFEQRKNVHPSGCTAWPPGATFQDGVDNNRNFDDHWGVAGSSTNPCDQTFRGQAPASEPENQGLQSLIDSLIPAQRGSGDNDPAPPDATGIFIDVHTFAGAVLWPWGHTFALPPNSAGLTAIGTKLASYNGYQAGQGSTTLYLTSGTTDSYVYGRRGAAAFTFELNSPGFLAPYSTVDDYLWPENRGAFLYAAKIARTPYMTVNGPDSNQVGTELDGSVVYVHGIADHTHSGHRNIAAAEFYVDTPPWADGAVPIPMTADDGQFDSPQEAVTGAADITGLDPGRHIVFMRGQDTAGNWGPVSAAFLDIPATHPGRGTHFTSSVVGLWQAVRLAPESNQTVVIAPAEVIHTGNRLGLGVGEIALRTGTLDQLHGAGLGLTWSESERLFVAPRREATAWDGLTPSTSALDGL